MVNLTSFLDSKGNRTFLTSHLPAGFNEEPTERNTNYNFLVLVAKKRITEIYVKENHIKIEYYW